MAEVEGMSTESTERALKNLLAVIEQDMRLGQLTDEELVREYFKTPREDDDLIAEEMATRLWPGWHTAEDL